MEVVGHSDDSLRSAAAARIIVCVRAAEARA